MHLFSFSAVIALPPTTKSLLVTDVVVAVAVAIDVPVAVDVDANDTNVAVVDGILSAKRSWDKNTRVEEVLNSSATAFPLRFVPTGERAWLPCGFAFKNLMVLKR